jgi:hypothetical protein
MQFKINVIHPDGRTKPLSDHSGVLKFRDREHARRMTERLAVCGDEGDRYEVIELPK